MYEKTYRRVSANEAHIVHFFTNKEIGELWIFSTNDDLR